MTHTKEGIEKRKKTMFRRYGKPTWNKGLTKKTDETLKSQSKSMEGNHYSTETQFKKGHSTSKDVRKKIGNAHKGIRVSEKTEFKIGQNTGEKNCNWVNVPKELLLNLYINKRMSIQEISKEISISPDTIARKLKLYKIKIRTDSESLKAKWKNPDFAEKTIKAVLKGLMVRPTSYENKISELCIKNKLPFIYTGDGRFLIGYKNPDFINKKEKIVIEVYHDYFKIKEFGSCDNYEKQRYKYFAERGWKTIFIRTKDIMSKDWEGICLSKISSFSPISKE